MIGPVELAFARLTAATFKTMMGGLGVFLFERSFFAHNSNTAGAAFFLLLSAALMQAFMPPAKD